MNELTGDWAAYYADIAMLAKREQPKSLIVLGCGFFTDASAVCAESPKLRRFVGLDREIQWDQFDRLRSRYPDLEYTLIRADVHKVELCGEFDLAIIDAHAMGQCPPLSYYYDTVAQCKMVRLRHPGTSSRTYDVIARTIVVDDCRVNEVERAVSEWYGEPDEKLGGATHPWVWRAVR